MSETIELQGRGANVEVIRCNFQPFQGIDENYMTLTLKLAEEDLEFYTYTKKRIKKKRYINISTNSTHYYVYGFVCCTSVWMFVNEYVADGKELHMTTTELTSEMHCISRIDFRSKPTIRHGMLSKSSVGYEFSIGVRSCVHTCDLIYLIEGVGVVEQNTWLIYEYLKCHLYETYVDNKYVDYNNYDSLLRIVYDCLKYYKVLVSPYLIRLFIRDYYRVNETERIIREKCNCHGNFCTCCVELLNFNFV